MRKELQHTKYDCRVIKCTSDATASKTLSSDRWTHNEESSQGLWLHTEHREDKNEQENQFINSLSLPLSLRERFTGQVMTVHVNNTHILLLLSNNNIQIQSNQPQNTVVISVLLGGENCLSLLND